MKWIKASDRRPDAWVNVSSIRTVHMLYPIVKVISEIDDEIQCLYFDEHSGEEVFMNEWVPDHDVEWLDESEAMTNVLPATAPPMTPGEQDQYLSDLIQKATPTWAGVDPVRYLAEVRGADPDLNDLVRDLAEALRDLHDLQNGPPLERDRAEYAATMVRVIEVLERVGY